MMLVAEGLEVGSGASGALDRRGSGQLGLKC